MRASSFFVILISLVIALILSSIPLPDWAKYLRPEWVMMVLLYWVIALPHRVGLGTAWILGLVLDTLQNTLLGEHAAALLITTYIGLRMHQQIRLFPPWQQAFSVMLLTALYQFLLFWVQGIAGQLSAGWLYWLPVFTSMIIWPWLFELLRACRRKFKIT